jgi:hypothetical protein
MTLTDARIRATPQYKALRSILGADGKARFSAPVALAKVKALMCPDPEAPTTPSAEQDLIDAGFSPDEAAETLAEVSDATVESIVEAKPKSPKDVADELVASQGLRHTRGRIYSNSHIIEAQARVLKTGSPEVIQSSGVGHTKAVVVFKVESGEVAVQNLVPLA